MKHLNEKELEILEGYIFIEREMIVGNDTIWDKQDLSDAKCLLTTIDSLRADIDKLKTRELLEAVIVHDEKLREERDLLLKECAALWGATIKVKNALAVGTWNVNPERAAFAVECSKLIQETFNESIAIRAQREKK